MKLKNNLLYLLFFCLIAYLVTNTGLVSDDFAHMVLLKGKNLNEIIAKTFTDASWMTLPAEHVLILLWYRFFDLENQALLNALKILYLCLSFYMVSKFFGIFLDRAKALAASFIFLFLPSHDSTSYWFLAHYLTLSFAFYLYAFYLANKDKLFYAFSFAALGSFISYGSPAIAIPLALLFFLNKKLKRALILIVPNALFIIYYIVLTEFVSVGAKRIPDQINLFFIFKQCALQFFTFFDAVLGPSMWLKIYYSLSQLSVMSIVIGIVAIVFFYKYYDFRASKYDSKLLLSLIAMIVLSFGMFAITGYYPQLAFNLGNRVTIFSSLLLAYLIVAVPMKRFTGIIVFAILIFSILGASDHWKLWARHQGSVIHNIMANSELKNYNLSKNVYVSGNQYSKLGKIGHIEFLAEGSVTGPLFSLALNNDLEVLPINKRFRYEDGFLIDTKHNIKAEISDHIYVYDSENDVFFRLAAKDINKYIGSLPLDIRHWIQLVDVPLIRNLSLKLMPRLRYAL